MKLLERVKTLIGRKEQAAAADYDSLVRQLVQVELGQGGKEPTAEHVAAILEAAGVDPEALVQEVERHVSHHREAESVRPLPDFRRQRAEALAKLKKCHDDFAATKARYEREARAAFDAAQGLLTREAMLYATAASVVLRIDDPAEQSKAIADLIQHGEELRAALTASVQDAKHYCLTFKSDPFQGSGAEQLSGRYAALAADRHDQLRGVDGTLGRLREEVARRSWEDEHPGQNPGARLAEVKGRVVHLQEQAMPGLAEAVRANRARAEEIRSRSRGQTLPVSDREAVESEARRYDAAAEERQREMDAARKEYDQLRAEQVQLAAYEPRG
jgi:hypothetical protein